MLEGTDASGPLLFTLDRPFRCKLSPCKCCCFQEITTLSPDGTKIGSVKESMYLCPVPSFLILDANDEKKYEISTPVCCSGMCVNVCAEGCCNLKIPFYIYPPGERQGGEDKILGKIIKEWGGIAKELFKSVGTFSVKFPKDATPEDKAALFAGVMLLDYNFFEPQQDNGGGGAPAAPETEMMAR